MNTGSGACQPWPSRLDQADGPSSSFSCLLLCFRNCFRFWGIKMYIPFSHFVSNVLVTWGVLIILDLRAALWQWVPLAGLAPSFVKGTIVSSLCIFSWCCSGNLPAPEFQLLLVLPLPLFLNYLGFLKVMGFSSSLLVHFRCSFFHNCFCFKPPSRKTPSKTTGAALSYEARQSSLISNTIWISNSIWIKLV